MIPITAISTPSAMATPGANGRHGWSKDSIRRSLRHSGVVPGEPKRMATVSSSAKPHIRTQVTSLQESDSVTKCWCVNHNANQANCYEVPNSDGNMSCSWGLLQKFAAHAHGINVHDIAPSNEYWLAPKCQREPASYFETAAVVNSPNSIPIVHLYHRP